MPTELGQKLSHFRLLEKIGQGGMGIVYRARDEKLRRDVALKILPPEVVEDPERRRRFLREARAAAAVNHPNIATIHEVDEADGVLFLAMELVEGKTLRSLLRKGALPLPEAVRYATGIARGLAEAHKAEIVHRDIKPENVIVGPEGEVKILDFGLAKLIEERDLGSRMTTMSMADTVAQHETRAGRVIGTAVYMSPEQARGDPVDVRSDIFSFGTTLYEMVTGRLPFRQGTLLETLESIQTDEPVPASRLRRKLPRTLQTVLDRCLAKEPAARYASGLELSEALRRVATGPRWAIPAMAAAVAVVAIVLTVMEFQKRQRSGGALRSEQVVSLVALPSTVLGAGADGYLADAIPQLLSKCLLQVDNLVTKLPPSSLVYEKVGRDKTKIANAYEVGALVQSILSLQADDFSLSVQLADAQSLRQLWSHDYRGLGQDYVGTVQEACDGLRGALRPSAEPITTIAGLSATVDAELAFQRGMYHSNLYNNLGEAEDFELAFEAFQKALALDPELADAAAETAYLFFFKVESLGPQDPGAGELLSEMEGWAQRALEIDPANGRALAAAALRELYQDEPSMERALALGMSVASAAPRYALSHVVLSMSLNSMALHNAANRQASQIDPLYIYPPLNQAVGLGCMGQFQESLDMIDNVLQLWPGMPAALGLKAQLLIELGRLEEGLDLLGQLEPLVTEGRFPPFQLDLMRDMATIHQADPGESGPALQRLIDAMSEVGVLNDLIMTVGAWLARLGEREAAFEVLSAGGEGYLSLPYEYLMLNPSLDRMREDDRFQRLVAPAHKKFTEEVSILRYAQARGELPDYLEQPLAELLARLGMPASE